MQINRLLETILILLHRNNITARELSERFQVSVRTIYRDVDILTLSGIPVYYKKGRNGGIYLDKNSTIDHLILGDYLKGDVILGLHVLNSIGIIDVDKELEKLENIIVNNNLIDVEMDDLKVINKEEFGKIKNSIIERKAIKFIYYSIYGQTQLVEGFPLKILLRNQTWFLQIYIISKKDYEIIPIIRVKNVEVIGLENISTVKCNTEYFFDTITVKFRFSKRISYKMYDEFQDEKIYRNEDGSFEIDFEFFDISEIYSFAIPYGANIEIMEPKWVREKIFNHAVSFAENNL